MADRIITLSDDDVSAFMAAVADVEDHFLVGEFPAVDELSRIASIIDGQVEAQ